MPLPDVSALPEQFQKPEGFLLSHRINADGKRIRHGWLRAQHERAIAVFSGGKGQFIEMDYENFKDLAALGISTYVTERAGESGSERCYPDDPQKPPCLPEATHTRDIHAFVQQYVPKGHPKPIIFLGHCLGGLSGLRYLTEHDDVFDHAILTSPMLRPLVWKQLTRDEEYDLPERAITRDNEAKYWGRARDWSEPLAEKLLVDDKTSHDRQRASVHHIWRKANPALRLGGLTHGALIQQARTLREVFHLGVLDSIRTPVTIISPEHDALNDIKRQEYAAWRIPDATYKLYEGARHGLWRESDQHRNRLLQDVDAVVTRLCSAKEFPRRYTKHNPPPI